MRNEASWWERLVLLNPALVRGFIVTVVALLTTILKVTVLTGTVDLIVTFVLALFGLIAAVFIKPSVTPNEKVIVYDDTPLDDEPTVLPGLATVPTQYAMEVERAAKRTAA